MGFFNSLKSQVGRDTGRAISNTIFGGRHTSTYHTRKKTSNTTPKIRLTAAERRLNAERELEREKYRIQEDILNRQKIDKLKNLTDKKVEKIVSIKVPVKKEAIIDLLQELSILLMSNNWDYKTKEGKIANSYSDAIFLKYAQVLGVFKSKYPKEPIINEFNRQYKKVKRIRFYNKYTFEIGCLAFILVPIILFLLPIISQLLPIILLFFLMILEKLSIL